MDVRCINGVFVVYSTMAEVARTVDCVVFFKHTATNYISSFLFSNRDLHNLQHGRKVTDSVWGQTCQTLARFRVNGRCLNLMRVDDTVHVVP